MMMVEGFVILLTSTTYCILLNSILLCLSADGERGLEQRRDYLPVRVSLWAECARHRLSVRTGPRHSYGCHGRHRRRRTQRHPHQGS